MSQDDETGVMPADPAAVEIRRWQEGDLVLAGIKHIPGVVIGAELDQDGHWDYTVRLRGKAGLVVAGWFDYGLIADDEAKL